MRFRCHYPSHPAYKRYSAAGIVVCAEWFHDYQPFMRWAMQSGYRDDLELDRRDNAEGYSPENCRWVTRAQNAMNRRDNLAAVSAFGEEKTPMEWLADPRCVVGYHLLLKRLTAGWPAWEALSVSSQHGQRRPHGQQAHGSRRPNAKLTEDQVREIRRSALSEAELGAMYGISPQNAGLIRRGKTWRHVA